MENLPVSGSREAPSAQGRVLILSAGVGGGHHAAAGGLHGELARARPDVRVLVRNGIGCSGGPLRVVLERCLRLQLMYLPRTYSLSYAVCVRWAVGRRVAIECLYRLSRARLAELVESERPDVIVSTYPGVTAALGVMRERAQLDVPVCAVVTDMAGLHFWAHPGVDVHLACYEESLAEIARISRRVGAAVRPPLAAGHWRRREPRAARVALGLDPDTPVVAISGGGWGVGDLRGAVAAALALGAVQVVAVCGRNSRAERRLTRAYAAEERVHVWGHTSAMADLLGAASVLVHSTGGVTCMEAAAQGCPVIAYGFGFGHVRRNVTAMARCGLVATARNRAELTRALAAAIASPEPLGSPAAEREHLGTLVLAAIARQPTVRVERPPSDAPASEAALLARL